MKIYYISPSTIPSRTANSIHVVNMCGAFAELGHNIILFTRSKTHDGKDCRTLIKDYYGVKNKRIGVVVFRSCVYSVGVIRALFAGMDACCNFST